MTQRAHLFLLLALLVTASSLDATPTPSRAARPNIIFLLTDDQRDNTLGAMGHPYVKTPHLDADSHGVSRKTWRVFSQECRRRPMVAFCGPRWLGPLRCSAFVCLATKAGFGRKMGAETFPVAGVGAFF